MKKGKKFLCLFLALMLVLSFSACSGGEQTSAPGGESEESYVLKFSANDPAGSLYDTMVIQPLKQKLEEKSGGRITLEIYYNSSMAKQGEVLQSIKNGTLDMGVDILTMNAGQFPYTELLGTPGINLGDVESFTNITLEYAKAFPEKGLEDFVVIARFSSGTFGILSVDKPITKVSDLKGMSMRSSPNFIPWWSAMGASPTFIPMGDIYESLRLSVIKGAHTTVSGIYAFKLQEVANYFTPLTMCGGDQVIAMSRPLYDSMPADLQQVIDEICEEMPQIGVEFVKAAEADTMNNIKKSNPNFQFVELEDVQGFIDAATPLLEEKAEELNSKGLQGTAALEWLKDHAIE